MRAEGLVLRALEEAWQQRKSDAHTLTPVSEILRRQMECDAEEEEERRKAMAALQRILVWEECDNIGHTLLHQWAAELRHIEQQVCVCAPCDGE